MPAPGRRPDPRRAALFERWLAGPARTRAFVPFLAFVAEEEQASLPGLETPTAPPALEPEEPFHGAPRARRRARSSGGPS
jgi:hypothetical protein